MAPVRLVRGASVRSARPSARCATARREGCRRSARPAAGGGRPRAPGRPSTLGQRGRRPAAGGRGQRRRPGRAAAGRRSRSPRPPSTRGAHPNRPLVDQPGRASLEGVRSLSLVAGDPASCSPVGGSLRQLATALRTSGRARLAAIAGPDLQRPEPRWPGPVAGSPPSTRPPPLRRTGSMPSVRPCRTMPPTSPRRSPTARRGGPGGGRRAAGHDGASPQPGGLAGSPTPPQTRRATPSVRRSSPSSTGCRRLGARRHRLAASVAASSSVLADRARRLRR